jgi:hypothetical protein
MSIERLGKTTPSDRKSSPSVSAARREFCGTIINAATSVKLFD